MRTVRVVPGMTAVLVSLVAIAVAGCSPFSSSGSAAAPASSAATANSQTASSAAPAAAPAATPSATSSSGGVQNLTATAAVKSELLAAFAAVKNIPASDVAGADPDSIYYAYDPATQTYWAMAIYGAKSTDSQTVQDSFQDAGSHGFFKKSGSGPWQVDLDIGPCANIFFFPQAVLVAWDIPAPVGVTCQS
jgi:hypothetical protein